MILSTNWSHLPCNLLKFPLEIPKKLFPTPSDNPLWACLNVGSHVSIPMSEIEIPQNNSTETTETSLFSFDLFSPTGVNEIDQKNEPAKDVEPKQDRNNKSDDKPTFDFSKFAESNLGSDLTLPSKIQLEPRKQAPKVDPFEFKDRTGVYSATLNSNKEVTSFKDEEGEWIKDRDKDIWRRKASQRTDYFAGTAKIENNKLVITDTDTGVTRVREEDGTLTTSFNGRSGEKYAVKTNSQGVATFSQLGDELWDSEDGKNWKLRDSDRTWSGERRINEFGQIFQHPQDGTEFAFDHSRELEKVYSKQNELTRKWGITFGVPGSKFEYSNKVYTARQPSLKELEVVDRVLLRNQQMDVSNLQFIFSDANPATDGGTTWGVYRRRGNFGRPQIPVFPGPQTEEGWYALEGTMEHELVHHEQEMVYGTTQWSGKNANEITAPITAAMGWNNTEDNERTMLLDKENKPWQQLGDSWINGKDRITNAQMRARAKVKPATDYFKNPTEMYAEALAMYRQNNDLLFKESPPLYDLAKKWDQDLIDLKYGKNEDKTSKYMRDEDGYIVENSEINRRRRDFTEELWKIKK